MKRGVLSTIKRILITTRYKKKVKREIGREGKTTILYKRERS